MVLFGDAANTFSRHAEETDEDHEALLNTLNTAVMHVFRHYVSVPAIENKMPTTNAEGIAGLIIRDFGRNDIVSLMKKYVKHRENYEDFTVRFALYPLEIGQLVERLSPEERHAFHGFFVVQPLSLQKAYIEGLTEFHSPTQVDVDRMVAWFERRKAAVNKVQENKGKSKKKNGGASTAKEDAKESQSTSSVPSERKSTYHSVSKSSSKPFAVDTGTRKHVISDTHLLTNVRSCNVTLQSFTGAPIKVTKVGDLVTNLGITLKDARACPSAKFNLISPLQLVRDKIPFKIVNNKVFINKKFVCYLEDMCDVNNLVGQTVEEESISIDPITLHNRMGHPADAISKDCVTCGVAKITSRKPKKGKHPAKAPGDRLSVDLAHQSTDSPQGYRWAMVIHDDYTGHNISVILSEKAQAANELIQQIKYIERQYGYRIKRLRVDNGKEFDNKTLQEYCKSEGIRLQPTSAHASFQNGAAERAIRTIREKETALRHMSDVPAYMWPYSWRMATLLVNLTKRKNQSKSPWERFRTGETTPKVWTFGCQAVGDVPKGHPSYKGLTAHGAEGVYLGPDLTRRADFVWTCHDGNVVVTPTIKVYERSFPLKTNPNYVKPSSPRRGAPQIGISPMPIQTWNSVPGSIEDSQSTALTSAPSSPVLQDDTSMDAESDVSSHNSPKHPHDIITVSSSSGSSSLSRASSQPPPGTNPVSLLQTLGAPPESPISASSSPTSDDESVDDIALDPDYQAGSSESATEVSLADVRYDLRELTDDEYVQPDATSESAAEWFSAAGKSEAGESEAGEPEVGESEAGESEAGEPTISRTSEVYASDGPAEVHPTPASTHSSGSASSSRSSPQNPLGTDTTTQVAPDTSQSATSSASQQPLTPAPLRPSDSVLGKRTRNEITPSPPRPTSDVKRPRDGDSDGSDSDVVHISTKPIEVVSVDSPSSSDSDSKRADPDYEDSVNLVKPASPRGEGDKSQGTKQPKPWSPTDPKKHDPKH
ncbi:hypothetical protein DIURU_000283, partial [Diutina rugosa]